MKNLGKIVITLSAALVCAYLLLWYYVQKTFTLDISVRELTSKAQAIGKEANTTADRIRNGTILYRKVDLKSAGMPAEEARLLELRRLLMAYEVAFGRPPRDASELRQLNDKESLTLLQRRAVEKVVRQCQVFSFSLDSYLLDCDGWPAPSGQALRSFLERFDKETEGFYVVDGHVFLYAPPPAVHPHEQ
jgi:hypothetical protein